MKKMYKIVLNNSKIALEHTLLQETSTKMAITIEKNRFSFLVDTEV